MFNIFQDNFFINELSSEEEKEKKDVFKSSYYEKKNVENKVEMHVLLLGSYSRSSRMLKDISKKYLYKLSASVINFGKLITFIFN